MAFFEDGGEVGFLTCVEDVAYVAAVDVDLVGFNDDGFGLG